MLKSITSIICFFTFGLFNLHGQIMVDTAPFNFVLVNNENVEAFCTDLNATFEDVRRETDWKPYDSTYTTNPITAIWLKFEIKNKSKDTIINYNNAK